jgi:hypothetical protein
VSLGWVSIAGQTNHSVSLNILGSTGGGSATLNPDGTLSFVSSSTPLSDSGTISFSLTISPPAPFRLVPISFVESTPLGIFVSSRFEFNETEVRSNEAPGGTEQASWSPAPVTLGQSTNVSTVSYFQGNSTETGTYVAGAFALEVYTEATPPSQQVFVYTMNRTGQVGAWSRYVFPFNIDATAQLGETLYLRSGDVIYRVDEDADNDAGTPIVGVVQWPWLDFGSPGATKMLQSVDVVGSGPGTVSLQIGYDQRAVEAFTPSYTIPIDTLTGMPVPMPVSAPTLSVRLTFTGKWSLQAVNVNLAENRRTT